MLIGVMTATGALITLVASQRPPMPTSTTATSTGASANAANAIAVRTSNLLIAGPAVGLRLLVDHLHERLDLPVRLHVLRRADRLAVDRDAFHRRLQVGAGGATGALLQRGDQRVDHPRHRGLAVGARDVDRRIAQLRRAEQIHQRADPGQARLDAGLRPALIQQVLDLQQGRDLVRGGSQSGDRLPSPAVRKSRSSLQPSQPGGDPVGLLLRQLLAVADLADDRFRRLGQEVRVAQFGGG